MKWTETVALPSGSFSRVIELDIEAQILDGLRLKAIGGRISYPKRHFSKGAAWEHLSKDPPQFQYESQTYEPDRPYTSYGQPPKTGRANPYRARHTEDAWVWAVAFGWAVATKSARPPAVRKPAKSRYERLKESRDVLDDPV